MIEEIMESANTLAPKGISYTYETDGLDAQCMTDKTELQQVILNLLINAVDAQDGKGEIFVSLQREDTPPDNQGVEISGPYAKISFKDTGKGMDEETKAHMFDAFFTTKEPGKGTGLGLAVVQGIIAGWGGFITVDTEPGKGSTFHIWLPAAIQNGTTLEQNPANPPKIKEWVH